MPGHDQPRFKYRAAALIALLAFAVALLVQQRAMADESHYALAALSVPTPPSVLETPPVPKPVAVTPAVERKPARHVIMMEITAYCPCKKCCGPDACGITASGKRISHNRGAFVAADTDVLPFQTRISIPGYRSGKIVPVIDRGGDIKGNRIDVFFPTHSEAQRFGRRIVPVTVYDD